MPHYLITYDLNGPFPTHAQIDKVLKSLSAEYGRVLETVWYIRSSDTIEKVAAEVNALLSTNDQLLVVEISKMQWRNLKVSDVALRAALATA